MATHQQPAGIALLPLLFCVVALCLAKVAAATPLDATVAVPGPNAVVANGTCEMVLDGPTCQTRCECEWCPPGPDHGCHAVNLAGPCGGQAGQRAPHDACYDDPAAGLEGLAVGALFGGLAIAAVVLWCCWRRIRSMQRGPESERLAVNGDDPASFDKAQDEINTGDVEPGRLRTASRPIDMPRSRARPLHT
nr:hypothetical protein [Pandoravirus aubagnensis]